MKNLKIVPLLAAVLFLPCIKTFSQQTYSAEALLNTINIQKQAIAVMEQKEIPEAKEQLEQLYTELESQEFTAATSGRNFLMTIGDYDLDNMEWPLYIRFDFLGSREFFVQETGLNYSAVFGKKYSTPDKMSQAQKEDYEFNVDYYDSCFKENPAMLSARLTYKILRWKENSEYCFMPVKLEILKTEKHTQIIQTILYEFSDRIYFITDPNAPDIRTQAEYLADCKKADQLIHEEEKIAIELEKKSMQPQKIPHPKKVIEHTGRRNIIIGASCQQDKIDFSEFTFKTNPFDTINMQLIFAPAKFVFGGIGFGIDIDSFPDNIIYEFNAETGLNLNVANILLPYAKVAGGIKTNNLMPVKVGGGTDIRLSHFVMNFEYNYVWLFNINNNFSKTNYHELNMGLGFSW